MWSDPDRETVETEFPKMVQVFQNFYGHTLAQLEGDKIILLRQEPPEGYQAWNHEDSVRAKEKHIRGKKLTSKNNFKFEIE